MIYILVRNIFVYNEVDRNINVGIFDSETAAKKAILQDMQDIALKVSKYEDITYRIQQFELNTVKFLPEVHVQQIKHSEWIALQKKKQILEDSYMPLGGFGKSSRFAVATFNIQDLKQD